MVFVASISIVIAIVFNDDDTMADFRALFLLKNPPEHIYSIKEKEIGVQIKVNRKKKVRINQYHQQSTSTSMTTYNQQQHACCQ